MKTLNNKPRMVIIDGKGLFYRGFYSMPDLKNDKGTKLGGVYGFTSLAFQVFEKLKPDYIAVAWDKSKTNIRKRKALYELYKANRHPAPPDFYDQIPLLFNLLSALNWPLLELDDYEADDIMGALALKAKNEGLEVYLVTSDLDLLQLIEEDINLYVLKSGLTKIEQYTPDLFFNKYGIKVNQFIDYKALRGDSSDNIPGVKGIGEKTAQKLLQDFNDLDNIYQNLELIDQKTAQKLVLNKNMAYLSKKLVTIMTDCPVKLDLRLMDVKNFDQNKLLNILEEYNFKSMTRLSSKIFNIKVDNDPQLTELISLTEIKDLNNFKSYDFANQDVILIPFFKDKEANFLRSFFIKFKNKSYLFNFKNFDQKDFLNCLVANNLMKANIIGYDSKKIYKLFHNHQFEITKFHHDFLLAEFLINPLINNQSISGLINKYFANTDLDVENFSDEDLLLKGSELISYLSLIYQSQFKKITDNHQFKNLFQDFDLPMIIILAQMEIEGIKLDLEFFESFKNKIEDMISDFQQTIFGYANQEFNIESPKQLSDILFDKLKISTQGIKKGKTFYSTNSSQLEKIINVHPIVGLVIQFREVVKLKNTYLDVLPKLVDDHQILHTTFNLTSTQTGRLSSSDPNLQNIPIRTDLGNEIRKGFVPKDGFIYLSADYSQFELRIAAELADDQELIKLFNQRDIDIHRQTAASIFHCSLDKVDSSMRRAAKAINFGILYGMSAHGLSVATGMNRSEAVQFIEEYKRLRKPLFDYMDTIIDQTRQKGYAETFFGRRRPLEGINSSNFIVRQAAERAAINMPIQGTEADLMKLALIKINKFIQSNKINASIVLQIHDSVLIECLENQLSNLQESIKEIMENVYPTKTLLTVDIKTGYRWGDL